MDQDQHERYLNLGFHNYKAQELNWLALVQLYLATNHTLPNGELRESIPNLEADQLVVKFMRTYGERLWPSTLKDRQHLALPKVRFVKGRSPVYYTDGRLRKGYLGVWRKKMGRDPNEEEVRAYSTIGRQLVTYFRAAAKAEVVDDAKGIDAETLLARIIGVSDGGESDSAVDLVGRGSAGAREEGGEDPDGGEQEDDGTD